MGPVLISGLFFAGQSDASTTQTDRWPGASCQAINSTSEAKILINSVGSMANVDSTSATVQCPVRTPAFIFSGDTIEWTARFATSVGTVCTMRLASASGTSLQSVSATSTAQGDLSLSMTVGTLGAFDNSASVRCVLPAADVSLGPQSLNTYYTSVTF
jgi:hypothetical protein